MGRLAPLDPFEIETPDEDEVTRRALERLSLPTQITPPSQDEVEAQAVGDAYRAMPDAEADTIEGRSRPTPGGRIYAAGDIPPSEPQRQRMMDRRNAMGSAATGGMMRGDDAVEGLRPAQARPRYMRDREDPRAELDNDAAAQRYDYSSPPPSAAPQDSTPAGGGQAAPPVASPPAGRDHTGADVGDAIQAIALMFGNILSAATGQQPSGQRFHSRGREEREQDRIEALAQRQRGETAAARQAERDQALALQREGLDRTDARAQAALAQRAELAAQDPRRAAFQRESDRLAALSDPRSPATNALREQVRLQRDLLPGSIRNALGLTDERLASLDGQTLEGMTRSLPRPSVGIRGSAGGGGGPRTGSPEADSVIADAVAAGIPENTARAMYANPRTRAQLMQRIATHPGQAGAAPASANLEDDPLYQEAVRNGVPPVTAREMVSDPDERARLRRQLGGGGITTERAAEAAGNDRDVSIAAARDSLQALREALPPDGQDIPGVGRVDSLRGGGFFQSAEGVRVRTLAANAVRRYLRLESGAAISDQEMEQEMQLRGLGPGATEQQFRDGVRDLERDLAARGARRERGSGQPQTQQAAPRANNTAPPRSGMVRMRTPNGRMIDVPAANAAEAERRGAVRQ